MSPHARPRRRDPREPAPARPCPLCGAPRVIYRGLAVAPPASQRKLAPQPSARFDVLDGWRGISILLVLATHMLPLGPKKLVLNIMAGHMGMALFFTLSGFLITRQLHESPRVSTFFVRRLFRIIPLAYAAILFAAWLNGLGSDQVVANLAFEENYLPGALIPDLTQFWSLCVEIHFYLFMGLLVWLAPARGLLVLPAMWLGLVCVRSAIEPTGMIQTHVRVDEIFSGALLALAYLGKLGPRPRAVLVHTPFWLLCLLFVLTCHSWTAPLHGLRGLVASSLVGHSLFVRERHDWLVNRPLRYLAEISYALYVVHPLTMHGWLGQGPTPLVKYARRLLCFPIAFGVAHVSTFHFEQRFIAWGKTLCRRIEQRAAVLPVAPIPVDPA